MIEEKELAVLLDEFKQPRKEFDGKSYVDRRREWFENLLKERFLLEEKTLGKLTLEQAKRIYDEISVGGPKLYPRTFIENGLEKLRTSLIYLLYGKAPLEERFFNVVGNPDSDYMLNGIARAFASTALFVINHKKYAIWNTAVNGGLQRLGLLPRKKRGEHIGQRYMEINGAMKSLQVKCGFEDLSYTDEFVELIYHERIGTVLQPPEGVTPPEPEEWKDDTHLKVQYSLIKIGKMRNYDVWVASNDRNKNYSGESLNSITLEELPHFAGPEVLRIAKSIDVIWFKHKTAQPLCFFEIEHSTSMYSGLLRLNDAKIDYPISKAYIVAPRERKGKFESELQRRTFVHSELADVCQFMAYEEVERLLHSYEEISKILL